MSRTRDTWDERRCFAVSCFCRTQKGESFWMFSVFPEQVKFKAICMGWNWLALGRTYFSGIEQTLSRHFSEQMSE